MPIYEYECLNCSRIMERLVSHAEADQPLACPKCGVSMNRLFSSPNMGSSRPERFAQPSPTARDCVKERHRKEVISMNKDAARQQKILQAKAQQGK